jgi:hypothetical protein
MRVDGAPGKTLQLQLVLYQLLSANNAQLQVHSRQSMHVHCSFRSLRRNCVEQQTVQGRGNTCAATSALCWLPPPLLCSMLP